MLGQLSTSWRCIDSNLDRRLLVCMSKPFGGRREKNNVAQVTSDTTSSTKICMIVRSPTLAEPCLRMTRSQNGIYSTSTKLFSHSRAELCSAPWIACSLGSLNGWVAFQSMLSHKMIPEHHSQSISFSSALMGSMSSVRKSTSP